MTRKDLRNIAIIAHVDHGKTTLVDELLKQGGIYRDNQEVADRVMDNNALERERGITILAKNASVNYKDVKINIVDTPGHADFGGEVERILKMVNGVILLVDAAEGTMPQTRFVLERALALQHKIIIVVNKIDRPDARCDEVVDEVLELLIELGASDEQLDSPIIFASGRAGVASSSPDVEGENLDVLFDTILDYIPAPKGEEKGDLQLLISAIDYNEYVGRIAIGRIDRGSIQQNQDVTICDFHHNHDGYNGKVVNIYSFDGTGRNSIESAMVGDIVCVSGIENITIGDTICATNNAEPLEFVKIGEPTLEMTFAVNDSPFAGQVGKFVTSRQIRDRLIKETLKDVSLKINDGDTPDSFKVAGRGEMHLSILIETMRREGYEFSVSMPQVIYKEVNGVKNEPVERVVIDVPDESVGSVMEKLGARKADLIDMAANNGRTKLEYVIPSRGLFGYRSEFLTDTRGEGILSTIFDSYQPFKGDISRRSQGSLVAFEAGTAVAYGLFNAQARGALFIPAGTEVYEGMVIGRCPKEGDLVVNVCKKKQLTNTRASGSDDALRLVPHKNLSLEESIEFLAEDELLEVTPDSYRLRKKILDKNLRAKANRK
ncbi:MAG: translational GTPase TypA [Clostridiales bacterium]|nr:translational GTPase TypA [Clostridiales bacterium]